MSRAICLTLITVWLTIYTATPAQPGRDAPVPTRQSVLTIPFKIGTTAVAAHRPVEVQLFVSANRGASWNHETSAKPQAGRIVYQAPRDGEYWFCVRTKDASGTTRPTGPKRAELRVIVDTTQPKLQLDAWQGIDGEMTARWDVSDAHLDPQSLTLEYRPRGTQDAWQPISVQHLPGNTRPSYIDSVNWKSNSAVDVRVRVKDTAGNLAEKVVSAGVQSAGKDTAGTTTRTLAGTVAGATGTPPSQTPINLPWETNSPVTSTPWPADDPNAAPISPAPTDRPWGPSTPQTQGGFADPFATDTPPMRPLADAGLIAPPSPEVAPGPKPSESAANQALWIVNSTRFELSYDLSSVSLHELRAVEIWGTADHGKTWRRYAADDDRQSPAVVQVDGEGLYGFRLLLQRQNGPVEMPPKEGAVAEKWVEVDRTQPQCQLTRVDQFPGPRKNELTIAWEASDRNLAPRPVTLRYSHTAHGPWRTIASGLENSGSHVWRLSGSIPASIYLRLEVRDTAENIGVYTAEQPITPELPPSAGRLREVTPLSPARTSGQSTPGARMYHFR